MRQRESTVFDVNLPVADGHVSVECDILVSGRYAVPETIEYVHPTPHCSRLFLFTRGNCELRMGGTSLELRAGSACVLPVWRSFWTRYAAGSEFVYFHFELLDALGLDVFRQCDGPVVLDEPVWLEAVCSLFPGNGPWELLQVRSLVFALLARCCALAVSDEALQVRAGPESRYVKIMKRVRAEPSATLTVGQLADEFGMSRHALSKGFARATGMPLKRYLTTIVMERALRMLATTTRSHSDIAAELGFRDSAYFHRAFRRHFGESPGDYRRSLRAGPHDPVAEPGRTPHLGR